MLIATLLIALFVALLLLAAANDIASMLIPNWISVAIFLAFPFAAAFAGMGWTEIAWCMGFSLAVLAIGVGMFSLGLLGGGDVKVIAAAAAWTGPAAFLPFLVLMTFAGGGLALLLLVARRFAQPSEALPAFLNRLLDRTRGAPYAVAIAIAGLAVLPLIPVVRQMTVYAALTPL